MKKIITAVFALFVGFAPLFAADVEPDWIDGSSAQYSRDKFVIGIGMGDDRASAEDRARGQISQVFSSAITVTTVVSESEKNTSQDGKTATSSMQDIAQDIKTTSSKILEGIEIAQVWQNKSTKQYYALAVLDKGKAISALQERISSVEMQMTSWQQEFSKATDKFDKVKSAVKMLALFKVTDELDSQLRVLDPKVPGSSSDLAEIRPQLLKAIASLDIAVIVNGEGAKDVESGIIKSLNALNMEAVSASGKAESEYSSSDIIVTADVDVAEPYSSDSDKWKWARANVTVSLKDARTGKIFLRFDATDRQASAVYTEALRRTFASLAKKLSIQVSDGITAYFDNR